MATVVARIVDEGVRRGVDAKALAAIVGPRERLVADARVSMEATYRCFELCLATTRDPGFPIHVARSVALEDYSVLGFACMTSPTAAVVFERMARYGHLISDSGRWVSKVDGASVKLSWLRAGKRTLGHRAANECAVAEIAGGLRTGFGAEATPSCVYFRHAAPPDVRAHRAHFGARVVWGAARDGLDLPLSITSARPKIEDAGMSRYFADVLERRARAHASCVDRVRGALAVALSSGPPPAADIARELGMSERSLRRALASEGTSYRAVLDALRREAAEELLDSRSATETAFLLGFSETSALSRAYRRWNGTSVREAKRAR